MNRRDGRPTRIAVCEDELIIALDIKTFLSKNGYEVAGTYDSAEALLAAVGTDPPDLVLMDIQLRGAMDGLEASARLLELHAIPVILLTAYADAATIERAKLTQPFGYVLKPYDDRDLRTAIEIGLYRSGMERRLRRSESRYRSLFEESLAAVFVTDSGGLILEGNRAFHELARGATRLAEAFQDPARAASLLAALDRDGRVGPEEARLADRGDAARHALLSAVRVPLFPGGGSPSGEGVETRSDAYLFQAFDVTERRQLQDGLARAQKMEALGRLAGGAAHDFNNIITAVLGYAHLAREGAGADSPIRAELEGIEAAARRAAVLARQLLVFSRRDKPDRSVFSLSILARDLGRMLDRLAGEDVIIRIVGSDRLDLVDADRSRMEQVLVNLVMNARDSMRSGGRITVCTGLAELPEPSQGAFGPVPPGTWSFLSVTDEGEGIAPELMPRLFEPFFTTKGPDRGTGLGLSTVAGIVRQADGHLAVSSAVGRGSTFTVYLPPAERVPCDADSPGGRVPVPARTRRGRGEPVMVVEDDDSVRVLMESMLEREGYSVMSARHPGEALILLEGARRQPRVLVVDLVMPLMRGPELAARVTAVAPGCGTLYVTGYAAAPGDPPVPEPCLAKPFTEDQLAEAVHDLVARGRGDLPELPFDSSEGPAAQDRIER